MEPRWKITQKKVFKNWVNMYLTKKSMKVDNLQNLSDAFVFSTLLELLSGKQLGINKSKKNGSFGRANNFRNAENMSHAFNFMASQNIRLVGYTASDLANGNIYTIMGVVWHLIMKYQVHPSLFCENTNSTRDIRIGTREEMLKWVRYHLRSYSLPLEGFAKCWRNGLLFCALVHYILPEKINFHNLNPANHIENLSLAFQTAEKFLGITALLEPEDMAEENIDEYSIMTYVSLFSKYLGSCKPVDSNSERVVSNNDVINDNDIVIVNTIKDDYAKEVTCNSPPLVSMMAPFDMIEFQSPISSPTARSSAYILRPKLRPESSLIWKRYERTITPKAPPQNIPSLQNLHNLHLHNLHNIQSQGIRTTQNNQSNPNNQINQNNREIQVCISPPDNENENENENENDNDDSGSDTTTESTATCEHTPVTLVSDDPISSGCSVEIIAEQNYESDSYESDHSSQASSQTSSQTHIYHPNPHRHTLTSLVGNSDDVVYETYSNQIQNLLEQLDLEKKRSHDLEEIINARVEKGKMKKQISLHNFSMMEGGKVSPSPQSPRKKSPNKSPIHSPPLSPSSPRRQTINLNPERTTSPFMKSILHHSSNGQIENTSTAERLSSCTSIEEEVTMLRTILKEKEMSEMQLRVQVELLSDSLHKSKPQVKSSKQASLEKTIKSLTQRNEDLEHSNVYLSQQNQHLHELLSDAVERLENKESYLGKQVVNPDFHKSHSKIDIRKSYLKVPNIIVPEVTTIKDRSYSVIEDTSGQTDVIAGSDPGSNSRRHSTSSSQEIKSFQFKKTKAAQFIASFSGRKSGNFFQKENKKKGTLRKSNSLDGTECNV